MATSADGGPTLSGASIDITSDAQGRRAVMLSGCWNLASIAPRAGELSRELAQLSPPANIVTWDCRGIELLDSTGAMLLWRAWRRQLPSGLMASDDQLRVFERIEAAMAGEMPAAAVPGRLSALRRTGVLALTFADHLADFLALLGQLLFDLLHVARHPRELPAREISANLHKSGVLALPVSALVGFLIGIVLSYLSALQLHQLGADVFIVDILGMSIIRELGPVLIAVLVAGRSGSAMTAQLGVMRVTEEIDALETMGVKRSLRLILPKVVALSLAMPLLVLWITVMALLGGMLAAQVQLDIGYAVFVDQLPKSVPVANLWIGLTKGLVFGSFIALVACHFGLRVRPNTESLAAHTTASVVTSITVVILVDAVFAIVTRSIGIPGS
jgi:phospholipid/cholesterol/gamma-HCH transport system permease protein